MYIKVHKCLKKSSLFTKYLITQQKSLFKKQLNSQIYKAHRKVMSDLSGIIMLEMIYIK